MVPWRPVCPVCPVAPAEATGSQALIPSTRHFSRGALCEGSAREEQLINLWCLGGRSVPSALWLLQGQQAAVRCAMCPLRSHAACHLSKRAHARRVQAGGGADLWCPARRSVPSALWLLQGQQAAVRCAMCPLRSHAACHLSKRAHARRVQAGGGADLWCPGGRSVPSALWLLQRRQAVRL